MTLSAIVDPSDPANSTKSLISFMLKIPFFSECLEPHRSSALTSGFLPAFCAVISVGAIVFPGSLLAAEEKVEFPAASARGDGQAACRINGRGSGLLPAEQEQSRYFRRPGAVRQTVAHGSKSTDEDQDQRSRQAGREGSPGGRVRALHDSGRERVDDRSLEKSEGRKASPITSLRTKPPGLPPSP